MRLYVGSLHFNITEEMLRGIFEPFGKVSSAFDECFKSNDSWRPRDDFSRVFVSEDRGHPADDGQRDGPVQRIRLHIGKHGVFSAVEASCLWRLSDPDPSLLFLLPAKVRRRRMCQEGLGAAERL